MAQKTHHAPPSAPLTMADGEAPFQQPDKWLRLALTDCFADNWDGEGAEAVSGSAVSSAAAFLAKLGREPISAPEAEADNDGWVTLEWYRTSNNVVNVCFGPNGIGIFASLLQGVGCHGEFHLNEESIDEKVLDLLRQFEAGAHHAPQTPQGAQSP